MRIPPKNLPHNKDKAFNPISFSRTAIDTGRKSICSNWTEVDLEANNLDKSISLDG
jgi:hypothetical protein